MGNNFIYPGRGREPRFNRSHIFFDQLFSRILYKEKARKEKGETGGGVNSFLGPHLSNNGGLRVGGFNGSFLKWAKRGKELQGVIDFGEWGT